MRIFLFVPPSANNLLIPDSKVWIRNLSGGLRALGFDVIYPSFDVQRLFQECAGYVVGTDPTSICAEYSERLFDDVVKQHRKNGVDFFLAYVWGHHLQMEAIRRIHDLGIPTILFFCNAAHQFYLVEDLAPNFDYCMVPERQALAKYRAVGANPIRVQMAADPMMYKSSNKSILYDVTFVGQNYLNRSEYIGYLAWHGVNVRVWGVGWNDTAWLRQQPWHRRARRVGGDMLRLFQRRFGLRPGRYPVPASIQGGILSDQEMIEIHSRSQLALNFSEVQDDLTGEIKRHVRLRDFEIPMSGGVLVTGYQEELAEFYDIGREIVCYDNKEELLYWVKYLLSHPQETEAIRQAGHLRAVKEHTWENRFRGFFEALGLTL